MPSGWSFQPTLHLNCLQVGESAINSEPPTHQVIQGPSWIYVVTSLKRSNIFIPLSSLRGGAVIGTVLNI